MFFSRPEALLEAVVLKALEACDVQDTEEDLRRSHTGSHRPAGSVGLRMGAVLVNFGKGTPEVFGGVPGGVPFTQPNKGILQKGHAKIKLEDGGIHRVRLEAYALARALCRNIDVEL